MRLPNLLGTTKGRLAAFFFLYMTEGIPLGFAATAVATQLRRQDVGPAEIGAFVAGCILMVAAFVVRPMRNEWGPTRAAVAGSRMRAAWQGIAAEAWA